MDNPGLTGHDRVVKVSFEGRGGVSRPRHADEQAMVDLGAPDTQLTWSWDYQVCEPRVHQLYYKSISDQWSPATELDWSAPVDPARPSLDLGKNVLSPDLMARLSPAQREKLVAGMGALTYSQLLHGEQGALIVSANLVRMLPGADMKQAAAAQAGDEARHLEVFSRYINRIGQIHAPSPPLRRVLDKIVHHPMWLAQLVGMQVVVEGIALAAFLDARSTCTCPLLLRMLDLIIKDEARHVAFGKITLRRHISALDASERRRLDAFTLDLVTTFRNWGMQPEDLLGNAYVMIDAGVDPTDMINAVASSTRDGRPLDLSRGMRYAFVSFILPDLEQLGLISSEALDSIRATMPTVNDDLLVLEQLKRQLLR